MSQKIPDGALATVSCAEGDTGQVYQDAVPFSVERTELGGLPRPATQVMLNLANPDLAFRTSFLPNDGMGLARGRGASDLVLSASLTWPPLGWTAAPFGTEPALDVRRGGPDMPIGDYSEKPAATVRGDEMVRAASQRMKQEGFGSLVVVQDGGPVGIVTDRDLVLGTLCSRLDPGAVSVADLASRSLLTIEQEAPVREAVQMIRRHAVRRLPVVDEKDQLVGIVAADDLLSLIAGELSALAVAVRSQSPSRDPQQRGSTATVSEHYCKDVATIPAEVMARDAADTMKARAAGSLVVLRDGEPAGIVTDRDLLERVVADAKDAGTTSVADVMSQPLQVASPEDPLERVVELMAGKGIRRVPVVRSGELVGIVALDDVLIELAGELHGLAEGMRRELTVAQRGARARELARDVGERVRDLGEQLEHLGSEAKQGLVRELDGLRERIRGRRGGEG